MPKYRVPIYRIAENHGYAELEADSPEDAVAKFKGGAEAEVVWDDTHDIDWWSEDMEVPDDAEELTLTAEEAERRLLDETSGPETQS